MERLIYWPSTPLTGKTSDASYDFQFPASAAMDWVETPKLRIWVTLNWSHTTGGIWSEGAEVDPPAFKPDNPGVTAGLNPFAVHGNLEVIPIPGFNYVSAYVLYDWAKPEARVIVLDPPGATLRTGKGSLLLTAALLSRHNEIERNRMLAPTLERLRREGVAKGLPDPSSYSWEQLRTLPAYGHGHRQYVRRLTSEQIGILRQAEALTPLLDLNDATQRERLSPATLHAIDELSTTEPVLQGSSLDEVFRLLNASFGYVRRGDAVFELRGI